MANLYPIAIIEDRYSGTYSGGKWLAIAEADESPDPKHQTRGGWVLSGYGPYDDDPIARAFWANQPNWIAVGNTPDEAYRALVRHQIKVHIGRVFARVAKDDKYKDVSLEHDETAGVVFVRVGSFGNGVPDTIFADEHAGAVRIRVIALGLRELLEKSHGTGKDPCGGRKDG